MASMRGSKENVLLVNDQDYLLVLLKLLDQARRSVDIMAYSFAMASTSGRVDTKGAPYEIAEKLIHLSKNKIKIRLYIEGRRETSERNRVTAEILKSEGIKVVYGATHAKGFCVDNKYVLFGSTNLTNQSIRKNHETNIFTHQKEIVAGFKAYFEHLWIGGQHGGITLKPPMYADGSFKELLLDMIHSARKSLEFSIYFFDLKEVREALVQAHERGVKVRGFIHDHRSFALSYVRRTHKTVRALKSAGIEDLHFAQPHLFTHSKYLIKDRAEIALGTGNWLREDVEIHPQLYVHLQNPKVALELAKHLQGKIKDRQHELESVESMNI